MQSYDRARTDIKMLLLVISSISKTNIKSRRIADSSAFSDLMRMNTPTLANFERDFPAVMPRFLLRFYRMIIS